MRQFLLLSEISPISRPPHTYRRVGAVVLDADSGILSPTPQRSQLPEHDPEGLRSARLSHRICCPGPVFLQVTAATHPFPLPGINSQFIS